MLVCEQWVANDFLARHGHELGAPCDCLDCPPIRQSSNEREEAAHAAPELGLAEVLASAHA